MKRMTKVALVCAAALAIVGLGYYGCSTAKHEPVDRSTIGALEEPRGDANAPARQITEEDKRKLRSIGYLSDEGKSAPTTPRTASPSMSGDDLDARRNAAIEAREERAGTIHNRKQQGLGNAASATALAQLGYAGGGRASRQLPADGSRPSLSEEIWVISKPSSETAKPGSADDTPGCGALMAKLPGKMEVAVPLKHTDVKASISAYIATVDVTQSYHNPYESKIEAVYIFPLPENAAVSEFVMTIGDRHIRGIIRERKEAERIYKEARDQGYVASLLTQERPNVFTQKVANIEPGKAIDIEVRYFHTLTYADGWYEFVFPMVVGPRFNPPDTTDGIGAVARGKQGISGQKTEVQYLKPGERSGHDISLSVDVNAGVAIEEAESKNHVVTKSAPSQSQLKVSLSANDRIPNKDFVLRYRVAGKGVKSAMLTHRDKRGGFFTFMLYPPADTSALKRKPLELVFLLDCSGSMNGAPVTQSKAAIRRALARMENGDTFQIIRFSNDASQLSAKPLEATPKNIKAGLAFLDKLDGSGGTMMMEGIKAALDFPHDPERLRFVTFLTDGYIGNEVQILGEVQKRIGDSRIFSFGVGSSPNRYLLDGLARFGSGAVAYLGLNDNAAETMDLFFDRISHPALTSITVDWGKMGVSDVFPRAIPDLFVGRPVILTGRFSGTGRTRVTAHAKQGGVAVETTVSADLGETDAHQGLPSVWARAQMAALADGAVTGDSSDAAESIKHVALEYGLMSDFTAFVAVDSLTRTRGDHGTTVQVPVEMPEGVRYDTTVQE